MKQKKTLYVRTVIRDLLDRKVAVALCVILFAVVFLIIGMQQGKKVVVLSEEQQKEIDVYQEKLNDYDTVIADVEKSLAEADKQVEELQKYVDNSIYMKIDPQNIQTAAVQYGVQTDGNVGNICNSFITFINDGAMKEGLAEKYPELQVEYWKDIISSYQSANTLTVTVIHYDPELAKQILEIVKKRIDEYSPTVKTLQGDFTLVEMGTSEFVKSDVNLVNSQNGHRNNLKNYISNRADFNNKLTSNKTSKESYIEKNEPESLTVPQNGGRMQLIKYMLVGIVFGIVLPCVWIVLRFIMSDRLRSKEELSESGLNVIGIYSDGKTTDAELERSCMDVQVLVSANNLETVFLNLLHDDEISQKAAEGYEKSLRKAEILSEFGSNVYESAEQLKKMIAKKSCILVAEAGKTTFSQLEQQQELCRRFQVCVLGCIVIE